MFVKRGQHQDLEQQEQKQQQQQQQQGFGSRSVGQSLTGVSLWHACSMRGSQHLAVDVSGLPRCALVSTGVSSEVVAFSAFVKTLPGQVA